MLTDKQLYGAIIGFLVIPLLLFGLLFYGMKIEYTQDVKNLVSEKEKLESEIDSLQTTLSQVEHDIDHVSKVEISRIVATAYNSVPWQTNSEPFVTSSGESVQEGTLALSRDLIRAENQLMAKMGFNPSGAYAYGDTVYVVYVKPMVVHDTMNKRYRNRADIWLEEHHTAREWGKRNVYIASRGDS